MHQAGRLVKDISNKRESELFEDFLRSTIVGVMPGVDFRQPQFFPRIFERAECCFRFSETGLGVQTVLVELGVELVDFVGKPCSPCPR